MSLIYLSMYNLSANCGDCDNEETDIGVLAQLMLHLQMAKMHDQCGQFTWGVPEAFVSFLL